MPSISLFMLQIKCYINWLLVLLKLKKPLLIILTGAVGLDKTDGIIFANTYLPGVLGIFQSFHREFFYETILNGNNFLSRQTLFEISFPKSIIASQLSTNHLVIMDRLTVDVLAFNYISRITFINQRLSELLHTLESQSLPNRYRIKIYFLEYANKLLYKEKLRAAINSRSHSTAERQVRILMHRDFSWEKQREMCFVLRHYLRAFNLAQYLTYIAVDDHENAETWLMIYHDALTV